MKEVFADTFYFLALNNPEDPRHELASAAQFDRSRIFVTTAWVLAEVGDALAAPCNRRQFCELVEILVQDSQVLILPVTQRQFLNGMRLYRARPDKEWSLTDCISFEVMAERGIAESLTGDKHFAQAGYVALLK